MADSFREIKGVYKLTRWQEYLGSSALVTVLGLSLAGRAGDINIYRAILLLLANFLSFAFAFMVNDIEDAEDDALDPRKVKRNPVSAKIISKEHAAFYTFLVGAASLLIFASLGVVVFFIGALSLVLGILYSWKKIRLKAWPVVDILSHALFLGTLEFLAASLVDAKYPPLPLIIWVGFSLFLISVCGDIRNELEDYKADQLAGLKNTSQLFSLYRFRRLFALFNFLPMASVAFYLLFTLSFFNLVSVGAVGGVILGFYYFTGYKKGRSFIHPLYSDPIQIYLSLVIFTQLI
jgi:4-hydroxybenzoate polyprenyltransferase